MKKGILLISFGTASMQGEDALQNFAANVRALFPGTPLRWAFTSHLIRERLASGARRKSDSVSKALHKMAFERYTHVSVQPLHVVPGIEYEALIQECREAGHLFAELRAGTPLLSDDADLPLLASALVESVRKERRPDEAVLFVGHGSQHASSARYEALAEAVHSHSPLFFVATMKGPFQLEEVLETLRTKDIRHIRILPLLSIVGRHTLQDIAGDGPESWRSRLRAAGFQCTPVLRGLLESPAVAGIWLQHLSNAQILSPSPDHAE